MDVARLRLLMIVIALAMIGSAVALVATTRPDPVDDDSQAAAVESARSPSPSAPAPTPTHSVLLPNVRSLPASEFSIESTADGRLLRFSSTLVNDGPGPLEVVPAEGRVCPPGQRYAVQKLYVDSGADDRFDRASDGRTQTRPAGCMIDHPDHDHWHFDAMARYALSPVGSTTPTSENTKVSFCLRDNVVVPGFTTAPPQHYGECETRLAVQGVSPGWADVYTSNLADQHLVLPAGLSDGAYCVHSEADPFRLLDEVDSTDNAAVVAVQITGTAVGLAPAVRCEPLPPLD